LSFSQPGQAVARPIPPLNPLYVFEVVGRVGSFTKAAEVLCVTPSAVSRQIASLEAFLDVRLFHRGREGNTLTDVGKGYYLTIAPAFETICSATERIKQSRDHAPLNVRVPSTFAVRFLLPRLSDFQKQHPDIIVRISTGFGAVDLVREDVDVSIQVGTGDWPGTEGKQLFANWVQPMCSPQLLKGSSVDAIDDLQRYRLLISKNRPNDWKDWARAAGRSDLPLDQMEIIEFPNSMLAFQAAADGAGIVIGQIPLLGLAFGPQKWKPLFGRPIRQGSYYAVWRAESGPNRKVRQFVSWLQRQLEPVLARLSSPLDSEQSGRPSRSAARPPTGRSHGK
jgi:LysR family glycine cleavage system transcriptional activator